MSIDNLSWSARERIWSPPTNSGKTPRAAYDSKRWASAWNSKGQRYDMDKDLTDVRYDARRGTFVKVVTPDFMYFWINQPSCETSADAKTRNDLRKWSMLAMQGKKVPPLSYDVLYNILRRMKASATDGKGTSRCGLPGSLTAAIRGDDGTVNYNRLSPNRMISAPLAFELPDTAWFERHGYRKLGNTFLEARKRKKEPAQSSSSALANRIVAYLRGRPGTRAEHREIETKFGAEYLTNAYEQAEKLVANDTGNHIILKPGFRRPTGSPTR